MPARWAAGVPTGAFRLYAFVGKEYAFSAKGQVGQVRRGRLTRQVEHSTNH